MANKTMSQLLIDTKGSAVSGDDMADFPGIAVGDVAADDWNVTGWAFTGEPIDEDDLVNAYPNGQSFNEGFEFTEGDRGGNYRSANGRTGSGKVTVDTSGLPFGADVVVTASNVTSAHTGHTCTVQVTGAANTDVSLQHSEWFRDYTEPAEPPGLTNEVIRFIAEINNPTNTGETVISWDLVYTMGSFNDSLVRNQHSKFENRDAQDSDYDWEWYSDSGYTSLITTGTVCDRTQTTAPEDITVYLQYRRKNTGGAWTQQTIVFTDPRDDA